VTGRRLAVLVSGQAAWRVIGDKQTTVTDLQYDSRLVMPGALFAALRGGYVDGHDYVATAVERGAAAIMVEQEMPVDVPQVVVPDSRADLAVIAARFFGNPSHELRVIGITGTDGKTTTSYIVDHILRSAGRKTGMIGTVSVRIGDETVDHETRQTTPESVDIQRLLRQMVDAGVTDAILEATSHGLDLHRLDHVRFQVGVVTNITQEHLEHHKSIAAYWRAKAKLFERVSDVGGDAVVNLDDAGARSVLPYCGDCRRTLTYSLSDESADLRAEIEESGLDGCTGRLCGLDTTYPFDMPLVGPFNMSNSLAALGTAMAAGVNLDDAVKALRTVPPVPGRMTSVNAGQPFGVIVDYAHTPESLDKVLRLLRSLRPDGRLIVVFGSAGERDPIKRPIQGRVAAKLADVAIITNEDPRFEDAESIIREIAAGAIEAGAVAGESMHCVVERRDAVAMAIDLAQPGDTVLLAGKGHERSIIWNGVKHPWDEATVAYAELAKRGWA
jgi:UDP-N-acetylmuramoyl-L-alanyl-D-glutamate--2,6-diaminopimelate ligase